MLTRSKYDPVTIPNLAVSQFIFEAHRMDLAKPALIDGSTNRQVTFGELRDTVRRISSGLRRLGIKRGDIVSVFGPNSPEYVATFYGVTAAGAVITSLNVIHNVAELSHQLIDSGAEVLLLACDPTPALAAAIRRVKITRIVRLDEVLRIGGLEELDDVVFDPAVDVASITYTNVPGDVPMGVMVTHRNLVANILQTQSVDPVTDSEVVVGLMPFCQLYGMVSVNMGLRAGATVVTFPHFSLEWLLSAMARYSVSRAYLVPPVIRTLAKHPAVGAWDLSALKNVTSMTAPLPEALARAAAERLSCNVRQAYGLTEAVAMTHFTPRKSSKIGSLGIPVSLTECRVVDVVSHDDTEPGELGEVWVRGPQVMKGYHNNPEITTELLDQDGWLRTCDVGYVDSDGYLFVVDRSKKLARLRGLHRQNGELLRAAIEDIAARLKASDKLRVQSVLLNSVRESVVSTDLQNKVNFWNKGAEDLFGYSAAEAIGKDVESLIVPDGIALTDAAKEDGLRQNGSWNSQVLRKRKDGSLIWTDVVVSIVKDAGGERSGFLAVHRDVSELRRNQELVKEAHERTRNLAARLIAIREQERLAIARELHDELGQALTRLNIDVAWLTQRLPAKLRTRRVDGMGPLVDRTIDTVRQISAQLRPPILDDLGLEAAIEWNVQQFGEWSGCRCELTSRIGSLPRDRDRDIAVFRILQEALTNVARHARAESVKVRAINDNGDFVLEVEDDGVGIPLTKVRGQHSYGLTGMAERAEGLGGELHIYSPPSGGTIVALKLKIPERQSETSVHGSITHSG